MLKTFFKIRDMQCLLTLYIISQNSKKVKKIGFLFIFYYFIPTINIYSLTFICYIETFYNK